MEPKKIYRAAKGEVPEEYYTVPIGKAKVTREGTDVTLVSYGAMLPLCEAAAVGAEKAGSVEVIDLRTIIPLDRQTVLTCVKKTGRAVIVNEAPLTGGFAARSRHHRRARHRVPRGPGQARHRIRHAVPLHAGEPLHAQRAPRDCARWNTSWRTERRSR